MDIQKPLMKILTACIWWFVLLVGLFLSLPQPLSAVDYEAEDQPVRDWVSAKGKTISAKLIAVQDGQIVLLTSDDKKFRVNPALFSTKDQEYLKTLFSGGKLVAIPEFDAETFMKDFYFGKTERYIGANITGTGYFHKKTKEGLQFDSYTRDKDGNLVLIRTQSDSIKAQIDGSAMLRFLLKDVPPKEMRQGPYRFKGRFNGDTVLISNNLTFSGRGDTSRDAAVLVDASIVD